MENIETINQRLIDQFGLDTESNNPMWRIVFSHDILEKRFGTFEDKTPEGLFIRRVTEVREVPKYRQYIYPPCHVLEHWVAVPEFQQLELAGAKKSYEPIFFYNSDDGTPLPPIWSVTKIAINAIMLAMGAGNGFAKYKDMSVEEKEKEFKEMYDYLYGNKSDVSDALHYKEGVVVPANYKVN